MTEMSTASRCRRRHKIEYAQLQPSCSRSESCSTISMNSEPSDDNHSSLSIARIPYSETQNSTGDDTVIEDDILSMRRRRFLKNGRTRRRNIPPTTNLSSSCESSKLRKCSRLQFSLTAVVCLFLLTIVQQADAIRELRCGPIDIRNSASGFRPYASHTGDPNTVPSITENTKQVDCTVVEGSFAISFVYFPRPNGFNGTQGQFNVQHYPRFPYLREITGTLLIFETTALTDLSWILPNLSVIGGQTLIQHYSLIIYRNPDLHTLGLNKLRVIRNGGVRIMDNKLLCHTKTIDWKRMIISDVNDVVVDDSAELSIVETGKICPTGPCEVDENESKCAYREQTKGRVMSCWNSTTCFKFCKYDREESNEPGPGCDPFGERCHDQCIGGCDVANDATACNACKHLHFNGKCVEKCPEGHYILLGRRCITKEACLALNPFLDSHHVKIKATNGICSDKCPEGYEVDPTNTDVCRKCIGKCEIVCKLDHTIDTFPKALAIRRCNKIEGNLHIEMRGKQESGMAKELREVFSGIHTITGYLRVFRSPPFLTLHMLRNLRKIEGRTLFKNYSLSIVENTNLRSLFDGNDNLTIDNGKVEVHNNRMLCFKQIREFMKMVGKEKEMNDTDQSGNSNGDKAICEDTRIEVTVLEVSYDSFELSWPAFNTSDIDFRKFLGYEIYFKEVDQINPDMTIDDDRSACVDTWNSMFYPHYERDGNHTPSTISQQIGSAQRIRPSTIYAFYVATQMVHHVGAKNGLSKIGFVKTLFFTPDPPVVSVTKVDTDAIHISWDPPHSPNGDITHYVITWREIDVDITTIGDKFCSDENTRSHTPFIISGDSDYAETTTAPSLTSMIGGTEGTCSAISGCCACSDGFVEIPTSTESVLETTAFENKLLDEIITQKRSIRTRRSIENTNRVNEMLEKKEKEDGKIEKKPVKSSRPPIHINKKKPKQTVDLKDEAKNKDGKNSTTILPVIQDEHQIVAQKKWLVNVTAKKAGNMFELKGLKHFTEYSINVAACQNTSVFPNYCSAPSKASKRKRTKALLNIDTVANETIQYRHLNSSSDVHVTWASVNESNGGITGYMLRMIGLDDRTPMTRCVGAGKGWSSEKDGAVFQGLADGDYRIEIIAYSAYGGGKPSIRYAPLTVYTPGFWTAPRIGIAAGILAIIILICIIIGKYIFRVRFGEQVKAYSEFMQSNPEYRENSAYIADEWELNINDVELLEQIGEGSFGKVFLGHGNNILSQYGVVFGPCAVKMGTDDPSAAENTNYLAEAQAMKSFKTEFVVKLYGVVSTVIPIRVVMELMELGNLRDFLRSKREDEVFNETECEYFDVITKEQFHEWATQICDGMAYLESLKFCHRDLACRNVMVGRDENLKIGDFGMARDLFYHDYYKPSGKRMMPVRWMSPESLKDGKFDSKSDIWSFGIVLYEMATLGAQPYIGLSNDEVLNYIGMARKIIKKPECCADYWYKIMVTCWRYSPRDRPTFLQLAVLLAPNASEYFKANSFVLNDNQCGDEAEPLDLEAIYTPTDDDIHPIDGEFHRSNTDAIPMQELRRGMEGVDSTSSMNVASPLLPASEQPNRQRSVDDEYALMNHSQGPSDTEVRNFVGEGDYVERDVQMEMPTRRNTGASNASYGAGEPYCLSNRGGSNERAGFGEGLRLTEGGGSGHLNEDGDYVEKDLAMDTRRSTGASTSSYGGVPTNWSGRPGATYYANQRQQQLEKQQQQAKFQQQQQQLQQLNGVGRGDRLTQLPGTAHLQNRQDDDYTEMEAKNNGTLPTTNGNNLSNPANFDETERLIEEPEHPLA